MGEFRFAQGELGCAQRGVSHCVLEGSLNSPSIRFDEGARAETKVIISLQKNSSLMYISQISCNFAF